MNDKTIHIGLIPDGAIVNFKGSCHAYMKVCDENGVGGVVRLIDGLFVYIRDIRKTLGLDVMDAIFVAQNLDRYYYDDED